MSDRPELYHEAAPQSFPNDQETVRADLFEAGEIERRVNQIMGVYALQAHGRHRGPQDMHEGRDYADQPVPKRGAHRADGFPDIKAVR